MRSRPKRPSGRNGVQRDVIPSSVPDSQATSRRRVQPTTHYGCNFAAQQIVDAWLRNTPATYGVRRYTHHQLSEERCELSHRRGNAHSVFLDEMLLSRLLFLWQMLTCFLIRLITHIQSPFSFRQVTGQPRTCLSDHVLRTPTVHPRDLVLAATDDQAAIRAEADG